MKLKRINLILTLLSISILSFAQRQVIPINENWNFSGASIWEESVEETVNIPHTWNTNDAAQGYNYYRGEGVYTKSLFIDETNGGKRIFLKFEGAQTVADVTVNDIFIGQHRGGYSAFTYEITDAVKFGEENLIHVKVDNSKTDDVLPLGGDFNIYGGIYRPVHLIITEQICITPVDFASPGVFLIQKNVSKEQAEVDVLVKISNQNDELAAYELIAEIADADGNLIQTANAIISIGPEKDIQKILPVKIENPILWNGVKNPYLYSVTTTLKKGTTILDEVVQPLGLRYYETDADKGFFLNGAHVKIKGVSRHNDFAGVASALSEKHHRIDMELIKEMGSNGIRLAHYQHSDYFYSLSDSAGMIVWAEIPFVGSDQAGFHSSEEFQINAKQQLQELIRQNYNHPSVLFWGLYNEIGMKHDSLLTSIIEDLQVLAKEEDPNRPTVAASFINTRTDDPLHKIPELIAWNQYYGWYYAKADKLGDFLDKFHEAEPEYKIGISEYGAGGSDIQHEEKIRRPFPFFHPWHPEQFQAEVHEGNWKAIAERPFVWGSFIWNMFDFGSHFRREGDAIGMNDKGMVNYERTVKKDVFYFYKANWSEEPVIHITNKRFAIREKDKIDVKVYSNLENVELTVNGETLGARQGSYATLLWENVELEKGDNLVRVSGQKNGKTFTDSAVWMYEKNAGISLAITFMRWLIKPFILLLVILSILSIWLLIKRKTRSWKKVLVIILLVVSVLLLLALIGAQIFGGRFGLNLFEYSLI